MSDSDDDHYVVGYGKPPREHQFKKGASGNPKGGRGKKKKNVPSETTAQRLYRMSQKNVKVKIVGVAKSMTLEELTLYRMLERAASGDARHLKHVLPLLEEGRRRTKDAALPDNLDELAKDPHAAAAAYKRMLGISR